MTTDVIVTQPLSMSMSPYTGSWTKAEAAHLLRRCMFGPTFSQIQNAVSAGMNATVTSLLTIPAINPPLTYDPNEAVVPLGSTWVNSPYNTGNSQPTEDARYKSLAAWTMELNNSSSMDISAKMCLFWQNHFAVAGAFDSRATYNYLMILRTHALGNFKQMIKDITIDPAMLLFLNGASNNVYSPNENFSRELLELYTLGKGPQIGPGDYSTYTESDIAAGAKIFTGFLVDGLRSDSANSPSSIYFSSLHDNTTKQLSYHFGNATVAGAGAIEYSNYIDVIFQQPSCATFICTKLYRYFVNYDLTPAVLTDIIPIMAQTLTVNNFNILPVMEQLLKSEHFYDIAVRGALIKSPMEAVFSWFSSSQSVPNVNIPTNYEMYLNLYWFTGVLGQTYLSPPNVGGWSAYYQAPSFYKLWLNSTYLKVRFDLATWLTQYNGIDVGGNFYKVKALNVVDDLSIPNDAVSVIDDLADMYCPKSLTAADKLVLKAILTNGLPDFEWTIQYNDYAANSSNTAFSDPVRLRVELVLSRLFKMAEFQTI
ncbi:MAG: DUF1800 family protein [Crocinitomicaceae bacterium]